MASKVTEKLIAQLLDRDAKGLAKYGTSLDRTDLTVSQWLQHQVEELMDGAGYAEAAKREIDQLIKERDALKDALVRIRDYLVHSEPVFGAMKIKDIAHDALEGK